MRELRFVHAINEALREEMRRDRLVFVMGEDVRLSPFGATVNLVEEFGEERVLNTPISENSMAGAAVGAAAAGMRPVVDFQTASFAFLAFDQLANQAGMLRYLSGGQVKLPIVYRLLFGARGSAAAQHSHSPHSMMMNIPGLKIIIPSTPHDAKGLLKSAIRDDNPVMFFEHMSLGKEIGPVPEDDYLVPIGQAKVVREGSDATIVATGTLVKKSLKVAEDYALYGISLEVIDPRTLVPLDKKTILESVAKTGRLVVADEGHLTCGFASELAAMVAEEGFSSLKAPIRRVATLDVPIPFSPPMEKYVLPDETKISKAIEGILE